MWPVAFAAVKDVTLVTGLLLSYHMSTDYANMYTFAEMA